MRPVESKQNLRKEMRQKRRELDEHEQDRAAANLMKNLLQVKSYIRAKRISMYFPNDGEIDPGLAMVKALSMSKRCYYPIIFPGRKPKLFFAPVRRGSRLEPDRLGILSPVVSAFKWLKPAHLDLILLPLVAFDEGGRRVGMGGGFYDASLAFMSTRRFWHRPKLIGIAHEIQKAETITADHWDIPLEMIVTDKAIYKADNQASVNIPHHHRE